MIKTSNIIKRKIVLYLLPIILWQFYWYVGFNQEIIKLLNFAVVLFMILFYFKEIFKKNYNLIKIDKILRIYVIIVVISMIIAWLFWEQNIILSYRASVQAFIYLYYFFLINCKITSENVIKQIKFFSFVYVLLWLYALYNVPNIVFGNLESVSDDRGFYRILQLPSLDILILFYFYSLSKIKENIYWIFISILLYIIIFLSLYRIIIVATTLLTLVFLLRYKIKVLIFSIFLLVVTFSYVKKFDVVNNLLDLTVKEIEVENSSSLRLAEYEGALKHFSPNLITILMGNGIPHVESDYGKREEYLKNFYDFNRSDSGYVFVYITFGLFGLFFFLYLLIFVLRLKIHKDYIFLKYFIVCIYFINITNSVFTNYGISFSIALYLLRICYIKKKNETSINDTLWTSRERY